ncbi:MAG: MYXO-CTERM sorting domain-containing protein [Myxococcales bacterium]
MFQRALLLALVTVLLPTAAYAVKCPAELPVLFISQDKSGTMADPPDPACPTCPSKWSTAKSAVGDLSLKFANRFRFGVQMYPHDTTTFNCTTGTTVTPFPADTDDIAAAYAAAVPGGGTPTAASLDAAAAYLKSLKLAEPAYVLLITDGLPNCNTALDPASCRPSQPACADSSGNGSPNCGAKGCLDDQGAKAAAARVLAAGFKVYVIGFDASVATNVNKPVLDSIAQAGGTGTAYTATDSASLSAALNAIAFDATTCCKDVCTNGASQCTAAGQVQRCQLDAQGECTNWSLASCPPKSTCNNGSCVVCTDECTAGAKSCSGDKALTCTKGADGCTRWTESDDCTWGEQCTNGACVSCGETCSYGDKRCSGADVQECELDLVTGCTGWTTTQCSSGSTCQGAACQSCSTTCKANERRCSGKTPEVCMANELGCTSWHAETPCTDYCSGGACNSCGTSCTVGTARCNGNTVEMCRADANGCTEWSANGSCLEGQYCAAGACVNCASQCTVGEKQCATTGILECRQLPTGCNDWFNAGTCAAGETCKDGKCVPPCQNECAAGAKMCDPSGYPLACEKAVTGCYVWKKQALCKGQSKCLEGLCREPCGNDELESCPEGFICTGTAEGRLCLPDTSTKPDAGTGTGTLPGIDDPTEDPGTDPNHGNHGTGTTPGCGCSSAPAPLALALAPVVLALLRRRRQ